MRDVVKNEELDIPEGVNVTIKSRVINVTGPRGTLTKNVRHVNMDIRLLKGKANKVTLAVWQGGRKHVACLRTIKSLILNMITGVTKVGCLTMVTLLFAGSHERTGFLVQNARCLRPFPNQLYHPREWPLIGDP